MTEHDRQASGRELPMLAEDIPPVRDLWPAIAEAIREEQRPALPPRRRWYVPVATAAAIAFMAAGFWFGRMPVDEAAVVVDAGNHGESGAVTVAMGAEYSMLRQQLATRAMVALEQLTPEERQEVERSLADIRTAVETLESALGDDPTSALLQGFLVQMYDEEMRVLTTMQNLSMAGEEVTL